MVPRPTPEEQRPTLTPPHVFETRTPLAAKPSLEVTRAPLQPTKEQLARLHGAAALAQQAPQQVRVQNPRLEKQRANIMECYGHEARTDLPWQYHSLH